MPLTGLDAHNKMSDSPKKKRKLVKHGPERTELTDIEQKFISEILRDDANRPTTLSAAMRNACPEKRKWTSKALTNDASRVYNRDIVKDAIERKRAAIERERRRSTRVTKAFIENRLVEEATNADRPADRIAALRALASMQPEELPEDPTKDAASKEDLVNRLEDILQEKLGSAIDVTPELDVSAIEATSATKSSTSMSTADLTDLTDDDEEDDDDDGVIDVEVVTPAEPEPEPDLDPVTKDSEPAF